MKVLRRKKGQVGSYKMVCDRSGQTFDASEMRKEWTGLWVHESYWEPRHPQEFVRGVADDRRVPVSRPAAASTSLQLSATGSGTSSDATITLASGDIGGEKACSRAVFTLSMTSYDANRLNLVLSYSDDGATYTELTDNLTQDAFASSIDGEAFSIPLAENTRYWRLQLKDNSGSNTYSASMDIYGSDVASVGVGDL